MIAHVLSADADSAEAARGTKAIPLPQSPSATILPPLSGNGGGKGGCGCKLVQLSEKAMQYRMYLLCYPAITRLIHALKKLDTLPEVASSSSRTSCNLYSRCYGEGHHVKESILRALPNMFVP